MAVTIKDDPGKMLYTALLEVVRNSVPISAMIARAADQERALLIATEQLNAHRQAVVILERLVAELSEPEGGP